MTIENDLLRTLGMALLHSLWEGAILAVILQILLTLAGKTNASVRYVIHFTGLMVLTAGFFTTWYVLYSSIYMEPARLPVAGYGFLNTDYRFPSFSLTYVALQPEGQSLFSLVRLRLEPFSPFLAAAWLTGILGIALVTATSLLRTHRTIRQSLFQPEPSMQILFQRAVTRMPFSAPGRLRITARQVSPMVIGLIKPMVVIPLAVVNGLSPAQVEAIMLHELAHIRRHDPLMLVLQALATRILFFHPLAWYLSAEIDRERENSCDDLVLKTNSDPITYIKALTMIQEMNMVPVPVNALTGRSKKLLGRVRRLLKPETGKSSSIRMAILFMLLISCGITAYAVVYSAKPHEPKPEPESNSVPAATPERDTIRQVFIQKTEPGLTRKEEKEHERDLSNARRELEKAEQEMLKAQQELERAREQLMIAREKIRSNDLSELQDMQQRFGDFRIENFDFFPEKNREFAEQMQRLQEDMKRRQEEMMRQNEFEHLGEEAMRKVQEQMFKNQEEWTQLRETEMKKFQKEWMKNHPEGLPGFPRDFHLQIPEVAPLPSLPDFPEFTPPFPPMPLQERNGMADSLKHKSPETQLRELEEMPE